MTAARFAERMISALLESTMPFDVRCDRFAVLCLALSICLINGCSRKEPRGGPRVETIPVTGIVRVNGEPANYLRVTAVHSRDTTSAVPQQPGGFTGPDGSFALSTYESGDGVPPGDYRVTFVWGEISLVNGQYVGDKLKGKYAIPEHSEILLNISSGDDAVDLGLIELQAP